jgi:hypothetical protein
VLLLQLQQYLKVVKVVFVLALASGKAERSFKKEHSRVVVKIKKVGKHPVFQTFPSETRPISSLPHHFLTRRNHDVHRAHGHLVRK